MKRKNSTAGIDGPELAARIKAVRIMAGLSQDKFAEMLGFTPRQIAAWEAAANGPPISILPTIRRIFDIDPEWVVMGPGLKPLRNVDQEQQDRRPRVELEVRSFADAIGVELSGPQTTKLVNVILTKEVADEAEMKAAVFEVVRTMASGTSDGS
jgi:transcriptional regulator with XRE-family HTH domain